VSDWDLIGGDPAPGDPFAVRVIARGLDKSAREAYEASRALGTIGGDLVGCRWDGNAANQFREDLDPVPADLARMAGSYDRVARALHTHAHELDDIKASVGHALTRARLARQRRDAAHPRRDAASRRIGDLTRQLNVVRVDETRAAGQVKLVAVTNPAAVPDAQARLHQVRITKSVVQRALGDAHQEQAAVQRELNDATTEGAAARAWADDLRTRRTESEGRAVSEIRGALADELKNRSNLQRFGSFVARNVVGAVNQVADPVRAILDGDMARAAYELRQVLDKLDTIVMIVGVAALVVAVVASGGVALAAAGALVTLTTVGLGLSAVKLVTSLYLLNERDRHGVPLGNGADVALDAIGAAPGVFKLAGKVRGLEKVGSVASKSGGDKLLAGARRKPVDGAGWIERGLFPNARTSGGIAHKWIVVEGKTLARDAWPDRGLVLGRGIAETVNEAAALGDLVHNPDNPIHRAGARAFRELLQDLGRGNAVPAVGPCYAN
jgi:hypothetical protein